VIRFKSSTIINFRLDLFAHDPVTLVDFRFNPPILTSRMPRCLSVLCPRPEQCNVTNGTPASGAPPHPSIHPSHPRYTEEVELFVICTHRYELRPPDWKETRIVNYLTFIPSPSAPQNPSISPKRPSPTTQNTTRPPSLLVFYLSRKSAPPISPPTRRSVRTGRVVGVRDTYARCRNLHSCSQPRV
jgi:hypothetical protein